MKLSEICIRQPVLAIVLNLILIVIGVLGYLHLDISFFPKLNIPIVTIKTKYPGAGPKIIENSITMQIENALAGVSGVESMTSSSSNSWSTITIHFRQGGNFEEEVNAVRDKVSAVREKLPTTAEPSSINVGGTGQDLLDIGFTDTKKTSAEIRDYVDRNVKPILREVPGVGAVSVYGASDYAMRIWLNAEKMAHLGITVADISQALKSNNIEFPGGRINDPERTFTVVSNTRLQNAKQFANIIITQRNGQFIRFKDIAKVEVGNRSLQDSPMRINGKPGVDVQIRPLRNANPIDVATQVKKALKNIQDNLPTGMQAEINYDQSLFLKTSIDETFKAIGIAILLVVLIVILFLGSLRASSIAIITIPLCLISIFGLMYLLDFSINVMTLLAIVLAIGLVVDDAIVMLENIHRYIEKGLSPLQAALKGSKQITTAVIAMTITLAAVYAPIGFAEGFTAIIFREFAFTLAGAVIISGFVALTLSPMMSAKLLQPKTKTTTFTIKLDQFFVYIAERYQELLQHALTHRRNIIIGLLIIAGLGYALFKILPAEFVPQEDSGILVGSITSPSGSSINYTDRYMHQIENLYKTIPDIQSYYSMVNAGSAKSYMVLKPWSQRTHGARQIVSAIEPKMEAIPGVDAYPSIPDPVDYGANGSDISVELMTASDYANLEKPMDELVKLAKTYPGLEYVKSSLKFDNQQFSITLNRDLAASLGVSLQDIADTMHVMIGGSHVTDFEVGNKSYHVILQMRKQDLKNFIGIQKLYVRSSTGHMVPLDSLIKLTPIIDQSSLKHYNRMRSASLTAQLKPGFSMNEAIQYLQQNIPTILTDNVHYSFSGKAQEYLDSSGNMTSIFLLAFIFIYLTLAAQFGSFIDPFIILLTVPLCIIGALATLKLVHGSLNLYSDIGLVTLVGLISKHGILITQFTNELREQGVDFTAAIIKAATTRLRPILMTTSAMVFGAIPLALASGPGSIGRLQIGWVIIGGLLFGTFFSLFVVPIAYSYFGKFKRIDKQIEVNSRNIPNVRYT